MEGFVHMCLMKLKHCTLTEGIVSSHPSIALRIRDSEVVRQVVMNTPLKKSASPVDGSWYRFNLYHPTTETLA